MKKFLLAAIFALPLTALAGQRASAGDCCTPMYRIGFSVGLVWRGWCGCDYSCCKAPHNTGSCGNKCGGGGGGGCGSGCSFPGGGPWYGYWPYPAHFQTPAPTGFPYWPAPMTYGGYAQAPVPMTPPAIAQMPGMEYYGNAAASIPMGGNFGGYPALQTVGYAPQVPAYWQMGR